MSTPTLAAVTLPGQAPGMPAGLSLRGWQTICATEFTTWAGTIHAHGPAAPVAPAFLVSAPPGAGKTRAALACASTMFASGAIDRLIVVSPGRQTAGQWAKNMADPARLDVGDGTAIPASSTATSIRKGRPVPTGVSITYAGLTTHAATLATGINPDTTLVILDEVHHMADDADSTWGEDAKTAFADVRYKMVLSGTPVRTDKAVIPFLDYVARGGKYVAEADVEYGMGDALADKVLRPLACEGLASQVDVDGLPTALDTLNGVRESHGVASTVRNPRWLRPAITLASTRLEGIRTMHHPRAAALVVCADTTHADQVAQQIQAMDIGEVVVVDSTRPGSRAALAKFQNGSARWLVSVQMVSEGVDIPRLAVCLYATVQKTELVFRQIAGRIMRTDGPGDRITAVMVYPKCKTLDGHVRRFASTQQATARLSAPVPGTGGPRAEPTLQPVAEAWASGEVTAIQHGEGAVAPPRKGPGWSKEFEDRLEEIRLKDPGAGPEEVLRSEAAKSMNAFTDQLSQTHPELFSEDEVIFRTVNRWARNLFGVPKDADMENLIVRTAFAHMAAQRIEAGHPVHEHFGDPDPATGKPVAYGWWPVKEGKLDVALQAMGTERLPEWMIEA